MAAAILFITAAVTSAQAAPATLSSPTAPAIPTEEADITGFGAVAGNPAPCTTALQKAIDTVAAKGGGRVVVPKGRFVSGPITLSSKIDLHLAEGAVLLMGDNKDLFPVTGNNRKAFISAEKGHDIRISGKGTIDGQGESWWKTFREEKANKTSGAPRRPQLITVKNCERVEVEGITTLNPPNTHYSFKQCKNLVIRGITALAPDESPNTDALNLSGVRDVLITGCNISTGDDNIVLLCGDGAKGVPEVENVTIRDCKLGFGHGLSIGSYTSGGVRNVDVENVSFDGTTSGIRLKAGRDRGGIVENLRYKNITMTGVRYPIYFTSYYPKPPPRPESSPPAGSIAKPPVWRDITIENVTIDKSPNSILLWGLPEEPIGRLELRNVKATTRTGAILIHAKDVTFDKVEIKPATGPVLREHDAKVKGLNGTPLGNEKVRFE